MLTLHQIWIGWQPIPEYCRPFIAAWQRLHPDCSYRLHGNELFSRYGTDPVIELGLRKRVDKALLSNRLRLLLLRDFPGIYADIDVEPLQPITPLFSSHSPLTIGLMPASMREKQPSDFTITYSPPDSPALLALIEHFRLPVRCGEYSRYLYSRTDLAVEYLPSNFWNQGSGNLYANHWGHRLGSWVGKPVSTITHRDGSVTRLSQSLPPQPPSPGPSGAER